MDFWVKSCRKCKIPCNQVLSCSGELRWHLGTRTGSFWRVLVLNHVARPPPPSESTAGYSALEWLHLECVGKEIRQAGTNGTIPASAQVCRWNQTIKKIQHVPLCLLTGAFEKNIFGKTVAPWARLWQHRKDNLCAVKQKVRLITGSIFDFFSSTETLCKLGLPSASSWSHQKRDRRVLLGEAFHFLQHTAEDWHHASLIFTVGLHRPQGAILLKARLKREITR